MKQLLFHQLHITKDLFRKDGNYMTPQEKLINTAMSYVGYIEKKSPDNLDDFTGNAGSGNYTSFARDYKTYTNIDVQGQPWCDVFVDIIFIYTFGADVSKTILGGFSAYTPQSANYFKKMNRFFKTPVMGDVIFFKNSERIYHTGIVYKTDKDYVYTIEGNTSSQKGVNADGGCVAKKSYSLNNPKIAGYGRPLYEAAETENFMNIFTDIKEHYAEKHITKLYECGIVNGFEDNTFRPDEPVTRGQASVMIANALQYMGIIKIK